MDTQFQRGTGRAPFALASCVPNLMGGPWRFSLTCGVTDLTARHYGGLKATEALIRTQIATVNQKFNNPGVFSGTFDFYVSKVYVFGTDVDKECDKGHWGYAYRVVYDCFPLHGGGWDGKHQSIYHSWYFNNRGGTFGSDATDGLVHEFGHARGAIHLYALKVDAAKNPVNGQPYVVTTPSIMNVPYGVSVWDNHSISIINKNKAKRAPSIDYITEAFPPAFEVMVSNAAGAPQGGVDINLYPVEWQMETVSAAAAVSGRTDAAGRFALPANPFGPAQPGFPWDIRYCNFLVEAKRGATTSYQWMPIDTVQNAYFANAKAKFVIALVL